MRSSSDSARFVRSNEESPARVFVPDPLARCEGAFASDGPGAAAAPTAPPDLESVRREAFEAGREGHVRIRTTNTFGFVVADAVRFSQ